MWRAHPGFFEKVLSASSGIFSYFQLDTASVIASGVASAIVILDGLLRPGSLRDAHYLAFIELRSLENEIMSEWHRKNLVGEDSHLIVSILIERIQEERKRISRYLKTKEVPSVLES